MLVFFLTVSLCTVFYLDNPPIVRHVAFRIWGFSLGTFFFISLSVKEPKMCFI